MRRDERCPPAESNLFTFLGTLHYRQSIVSPAWGTGSTTLPMDLSPRRQNPQVAESAANVNAVSAANVNAVSDANASAEKGKKGLRRV